MGQPMFYDGTVFWQVLQSLGYGNLTGEIITRKLQHVYVHWSIMLVFLLATLVSLVVMVRRRRDFVQAVPIWTIPLLLVYCVVVGMLFFNEMGFSHAMLNWPVYKYIRTMLRSLAVAVVPVESGDIIPISLNGVMTMSAWAKAHPTRLVAFSVAFPPTGTVEWHS
jgi:hypothetical protein